MFCLACGGAPQADPVDRAQLCADTTEVLDRARGLAADGYLGRALPIAERADRACSTDDSRRLLASIYDRLGLADLAREAYRRAGDARQVAAEARHPLAIVKAGVELRRSGDAAGARAVYARALAVAEARATRRAEPVLVHAATSDLVATAFHPSGKQVAVALARGRVELWDLAARRVVRLFDHGGARWLAFSPTGALLITASGERVAGWEVATGSRLFAFDLTVTGPPAVAADGATALVPAADGVHRIELARGRLSRAFDIAGATVVAPTPRGGAVAVSSPDRSAVIAAGSGAARLQLPGLARARFAPDGALLAAVTAGGDLVLLEANTGAELGRHRVGTDVVDIGFRAATRQVVVLTARGRITAWSVTGAGDSTTLDLEATGLALGPAARAALVALPGALELRAAGDRRTLVRLDGQARRATAIAVDGEGRRVALGTAGGAIALWDFERARFALLPDHGAAVRALAFSGSGERLVSAADDGVRVWDMASAHQLARLASRPASAVAIDAGGNLVTARVDGRVLAWEVTSAREQPVPAALVPRPAPTELRASGGGLTATAAPYGVIRIVRGDRPIAQLVSPRSGDWLVVAADGRVDGSTGAQRQLVWQIGAVQLPGFVGWQRNATERLLGELGAN